MKKLLGITALALVSFSANAAIVTVNITSGDWASNTTWNNNADASVNTTTLYDNGDAIPGQILGFMPFPAGQWSDESNVPRGDLLPFNGTYGGSITYDDVTGDVISGSLVATGRIGDQVQVGGSSWWLRIWEDVSIDLATGLSTVGSVDCAKSLFAPAGCSPGVISGMPFAFNISAGSATPGGCYLPGATNDPINDAASTAPPCGPNGPALGKASFDGTTLSLFKEGRDAAGNVNGTDSLYAFTLTTAVVPVPAAVWLFGSAIGLLGFRRKMKA